MNSIALLEYILVAVISPIVSDLHYSSESNQRIGNTTEYNKLVLFRGYIIVFIQINGLYIYIHIY